jgi:hypothetical protein
VVRTAERQGMQEVVREDGLPFIGEEHPVRPLIAPGVETAFQMTFLQLHIIQETPELHHLPTVYLRIVHVCQTVGHVQISID